MGRMILLFIILANFSFNLLAGEKVRKIMICPTNNREKVNAHLESMGYGPNTFSVGLFDEKTNKIEYYLCNWFMPVEDFQKIEAYLIYQEVDIKSENYSDSNSRMAVKSIMSNMKLRKSNPSDYKINGNPSSPGRMK